MSEEQSSQETHEVENNRPGQAGVPEGEIIPGETGRDRTDNEKLDDAALRFMADAAYTVARFTGLVRERATSACKRDDCIRTFPRCSRWRPEPRPPASPEPCS